MQLSLQQLFGANAYQDSDRLVISKDDLSNFSASAINTAESLLVALILNALKQFEGIVTDELDRPITGESSKAITYNNSKLYQLLNIFYWKQQFILFQSRPKILDTFVIESYEVQ